MQGSVLADRFQHYFEARLVETPVERTAAFRLRHRVYCDEFHYIPASVRDEGQEHDEYDALALHVLLTHRPSGMPAGYFRVLSNARLPHDWQLPFERYCSEALYDDIIDPRQLPRNSYGELSRLAVPSLFRRRKNEQFARVPIGDNNLNDPEDSRNFPLIPVSLLLAASTLMEEQGIRYLFAMLEPRLARVLRQQGLQMHRIGNLTDYHGIRAPFFLRTDDMRDRLHPDAADLASVIQAQLMPSAAVH